jgi:hypothetical protein
VTKAILGKALLLLGGFKEWLSATAPSTNDELVTTVDQHLSLRALLWAYCGCSEVNGTTRSNTNMESGEPAMLRPSTRTDTAKVLQLTELRLGSWRITSAYACLHSKALDDNDKLVGSIH